MHLAIPNFRSMTADGIEIEVSYQFPPLAQYLPSPNRNSDFSDSPRKTKKVGCMTSGIAMWGALEGVVHRRMLESIRNTDFLVLKTAKF